MKVKLKLVDKVTKTVSTTILHTFKTSSREMEDIKMTQTEILKMKATPCKMKIYTEQD